MQRIDLSTEKLNSMEFNFGYDGNYGIEHGFKVFLINTESLLIVIISPLGKINPRTKAVEIYEKIEKLLSLLAFDTIPKKIYLNLLNINGMGNPYLYEWNFEKIDLKVREKIHVLDIQTLSNEGKSILKYYYDTQLSIFNNSALNDKQKIEIIAYNLAENCYDEFVLENWMKYFRLFLNKFKRKKSS